MVLDRSVRTALRSALSMLVVAAGVIGVSTPAHAYPVPPFGCAPRADLNVYIADPLNWPGWAVTALQEAVTTMNGSYTGRSGSTVLLTRLNDFSVYSVPLYRNDTITQLGTTVCPGGNPSLINLRIGAFTGNTRSLRNLISHEIGHAHGLGHSGWNHSMTGPSNMPVMATCWSTLDFPEAATPDDVSQAASRLDPLSLKIGHAGFERDSLNLNGWNATGSAGVIGAWSWEGNRSAWLYGYNTYLETGVEISLPPTQLRMAYAYSASTTGSIGWELFRRTRAYPAAPSGSCELTAPMISNIDLNHPASTGAWALIAAAGANGQGFPQVTGAYSWVGYTANPTPLYVSPNNSAQIAFRVYNQLNANGYIYVDNATGWPS